MVNLTVFLKHDSVLVNELEEIFWQVSDPTHPKRGEYLTAEQVCPPIVLLRFAHLTHKCRSQPACLNWSETPTRLEPTCSHTLTL